MATTTPVVAVAQTKEIARLFPAAVYGGRVARALDALAALDARVRADLLSWLVVPETVPFVRPHAGSLYEADTLTWCFYHANAGCVVHAINNEAYGAALARALYANLLFQLEEDKANEEAAEAYSFSGAQWRPRSTACARRSSACAARCATFPPLPLPGTTTATTTKKKFALF
jgi:hypothetical protein